MDAIDNLKPKLREVIVMFEMQDMSYEEIAQKMVQGKLEKFFKENVLLEQLSMVDEKMQVRDYLKKIDPNMVIKDFKRISVG